MLVSGSGSVGLSWVRGSSGLMSLLRNKGLLSLFILHVFLVCLTGGIGEQSSTNIKMSASSLFFIIVFLTMMFTNQYITKQLLCENVKRATELYEVGNGINTITNFVRHSWAFSVEVLLQFSLSAFTIIFLVAMMIYIPNTNFRKAGRFELSPWKFYFEEFAASKVFACGTQQGN